MQRLMLLKGQTEDSVIASGVQPNVRQRVPKAAQQLAMRFRFDEESAQEVATELSVEAGNPVLEPGQVTVRVDPLHCHPTEIETPLGNPSKAKAKPGCTTRISPPEPVTSNDQTASRDNLTRRGISALVTTLSDAYRRHVATRAD